MFSHLNYSNASMLGAFMSPQRGYHSLKQRFRAAIAAFLVFAPQSEDQLVKAIDAVITDQTGISEHDRVFQVIPFGLYWHQDLQYLTQYLRESPEQLIIGLAIALCCRHEFNPRTLISESCKYLSADQNSEHQDVISQLKLAQFLVERGESRAIARSILKPESLAYGLFCFLSNSQNLELATYDSGKFEAEIAAIAAAHQGYVFNTAATMKLSDRLLAAWSGLYNLELEFDPAIAAPDLLKRRF
jgi:hypothetical protein